MDLKYPKTKFDTHSNIVQPHYPSIFHGREEELTKDIFTKNDIIGYANEIIEWGKIQDIEPGGKNQKYPKPYRKDLRDGQYKDKDGNTVPRNSPEAHQDVEIK